jgi:peroxiredoxin
MSRLWSILALSASAVFAQPVLRPAPELTVVEPSGAKTALASQKGKVVVLDFIFTTCIHCQDETRMLEKIYKDMHPKGLEIFSVAINDNAQLLVPGFKEQYAVPWMVGFGRQEDLLNYMGFSMMDRWAVPQVVVIDRKGMVRAQTPAPGDPNLQSETYMRDLLTKLLAEKGPATKSVKTTASR